MPCYIYTCTVSFQSL